MRDRTFQVGDNESFPVQAMNFPIKNIKFPMQAKILQAIASFHLSKPDAVVGCTKFDLCAEFLKQAAIDPDFYVQVHG
jgi:hypothetical protein